VQTKSKQTRAEKEPKTIMFEISIFGSGLSLIGYRQLQVLVSFAA